MSDVAENTRRIRSAVRVFMSPGLWLVMAVQMLFLVVLNTGNEAVASTEGGGSLRPLILMALFMLILFLLSGAFRALAAHQNPVTVPEIFSSANKIFSQFLLLCLKTLGLFLLGSFVVVSFAMPAGGGEPDKETLHQMLMTIGIAAVVLDFVFIYWLPLVFTTLNFRLFQTLMLALRIARGRLSQAGFIALLIFVPALISLYIPQGASLLVIAPVGLLGQVTGWIVYAYCIEYLSQNRDKITVMPDSNHPL